MGAPRAWTTHERFQLALQVERDQRERERREAWEKAQPAINARFHARRKAYADGIEAATRSGAKLTLLLRRMIEHVCDLAFDPPAMSVSWSHADSAARQHSYGVAYMRQRHIVIPAIIGPVEYGVALHEIGHVRDTERSSGELDHEPRAWAYAMRTAIHWDASMTAELARALRVYIGKSNNERAIVATERFH